MNKQLTKQINTYKRKIENRKAQETIYTVLIIIIILFFDLFGVYYMFKNSKKKQVTLEKLRDLNQKLSLKRDRTNETIRKLEESKPYLDELRRSVPAEPNVEEYMVNVANIASRHGYKQDALRRKGQSDNYLELRISFKGQKSQLPFLIESLEKQDRLAVIESFNYTVTEQAANFELVAKIYYSKGQF